MTSAIEPFQFAALAGTFILSASLSLYLTPLIRRGALQYNILDAPNSDLKTHKQPTPYLGGIAVYLSFLITLAVIFDFSPHLVGLLLGGTMIAMVGLFDDLRVLPAVFKLVIELLIVWIVIKSDISIQLVILPAAVTIPLTVLWLIGISNAINILDVSDGLATSVSAIASLFFFVIALLNGNLLVAASAIALVGSLLGFLYFNKEPASIYLGDTGSLFIGFMLAALGMIGSYTTNSILGITAPIIILFVPIFDVCLCSIARLRKGISPLTGSPDHFALRLKNRGWTASRVASITCLFGTLTGTTGIIITQVDFHTALILTCVTGALFISLLLFFLIKIPAPEKPVTPPSER